MFRSNGGKFTSDIPSCENTPPTLAPEADATLAAMGLRVAATPLLFVCCLLDAIGPFAFPRAPNIAARRGGSSRACVLQVAAVTVQAG